jgi:prolyl-tRNA editing enzyme YbaK/EbsC (Cys-tRNA(Pro) deacylase)
MPSTVRKVKKKCTVLARSKVEAKRARDLTGEIIHAVYPIGDVTLPVDLYLPYTEKVEFVKDW